MKKLQNVFVTPLTYSALVPGIKNNRSCVKKDRSFMNKSKYEPDVENELKWATKSQVLKKSKNVPNSVNKQE